MKKYTKMNGFTLLEVVAILVILSIITVLAVSRFSSNQYKLIAARDALVSHLRLAQSRAMSTSVDSVNPSDWGVRFISTTQYHLFYCNQASTCDPTVAANQQAFLGADSIIVNITNNVQVTNGALVLAFDRFGTPFIDATLTTKLTSQLTLTLKDNNGNTMTINITPETGMISS
ncbi:MAG: GspH/FimT family pseudopilin [Smithella sp.]|jgi:Tfp pilus assembly protein FimT